MTDFDQRYPHARSTERMSNWPANLRAISVNGLRLLAFDGQGRLYVDGKPVELARGISLTRLQKIAAVATVIAAILGGFGAIATAAVEWLQYPHP